MTLTLPQVPTAVEIAPYRAPRQDAAPPKIGETMENYPRVVAVLGSKTRVIECAAGVQWIIQRRVHKGRHPWEGTSFCRTKEALLRLTGSDHPALASLPDRFPEAGHD
jgi:hypothetical protein